MQVLLFCSISYSGSSISFRTLSVTPVPDAHAPIGPQVGPPVATWTTPERAVGHCVWWPSPPDAKASASKRCHKHSTFVDGKKILQHVDIENIPIYIPVVPGQAGGGSFQKEKNYIAQKNLPIECAQGDGPARCPNHFFAVNEPSAVPWW